MERGESMLTLIKVRLCPFCSEKLNYKHAHEKAKKKKAKPKKSKAATETSTETSSGGFFNSAITIKEEILTDAEDHHPNPNSGNYEDLIDQIWKKPVKLEPEETETTLEEEVDDYLNQLFV